MKTLEQLGISPAPWNLSPYGPSTMSTVATHGDIETADGRSFFPNGDFPEIQDARMIAAAPELYEALSVLLNFVKKETAVSTSRGMYIAMEKARKAIEKAGGAERGSLMNSDAPQLRGRRRRTRSERLC